MYANKCLGQERSERADALSAKVRTERGPYEQLPGVQNSGAVLLPNGWSLQPQGKQASLGDFPVRIAVHPGGKEIAVLHAGYGEHEIIVLDIATQNKISRVPLPQSFYGLTFSGDGNWLIASGGEDERVYTYPYNDGFLGKPTAQSIAKKTDKFVVSGVGISSDNQTLYACGLLANAVKRFPSRIGQKESVRDADIIAGELLALPEESYPYQILEDRPRDRAFVSLWGRAEVGVIRLSTWTLEARWKTKSHPTEMALLNDGERMVVACSDDNSVVVLDGKTGETKEVLSTSLHPKAKNGSTPSALAVSPDGRVLAAVNSDNNNVALFDMSFAGATKSLGFIPVGWYPTNVAFSVDGSQIIVTNGKGASSKDNRYGPNPLKAAPKNLTEYIGGLLHGTLSIIPSPTPMELASMTRIAYQVSPILADSAVVESDRSTDNPIPAKVGDASPIKHCIYIVKENRTYDQVFGDVAKGNGDPGLCIFGEQVTPNHHALVERFVLLDNFYVNGEVSADGHEWTMAGYASDFVEKIWPLTYGKSRGKLTYPAEGATKIGQPSSGYFWHKCAEANKSYYSFGEFVANGRKAGDPARAKIPILEGHFDPDYRAYDLDYSDLDRAASFVNRLKQFEKEDNFPSFVSIHLGNDHTSGTRVGKLTPTAMVAQNDAALGRIVEAVSKSKFWSETAIFVVQDDAQNGSDHVDAHRSVALAISPYIKPGTVDSTMYSTTSMLRTMGLILGVEPMTQYDAAARPMYACFDSHATMTPFEAVAPLVDIEATNQALAWGAAVSEELDFSTPDAADDLVLNEIVWRSVRGADSPMPPPVRAAFVFISDNDDDDEDEDDDDEEDDDVERIEEQENAGVGLKQK